MRTIYISLLLLFFCTSTGCQKRTISVSKKEYKKKQNQGFWVIKNKKAIHYNQSVAKPKLDKQNKKLAAENRSIQKQNIKNQKKFADNQELLKTFDHH